MVSRSPIVCVRARVHIPVRDYARPGDSRERRYAVCASPCYVDQGFVDIFHQAKSEQGRKVSGVVPFVLHDLFQSHIVDAASERAISYESEFGRCPG